MIESPNIWITVLAKVSDAMSMGLLKSEEYPCRTFVTVDGIRDVYTVPEGATNHVSGQYFGRVVKKKQGRSDLFQRIASTLSTQIHAHLQHLSNLDATEVLPFGGQFVDGVMGGFHEGLSADFPRISAENCEEQPRNPNRAEEFDWLDDSFHSLRRFGLYKVVRASQVVRISYPNWRGDLRVAWTVPEFVPEELVDEWHNLCIDVDITGRLTAFRRLPSICPDLHLILIWLLDSCIRRRIWKGIVFLGSKRGMLQL
ncbi:hypothetical protein R1flu_009655 [Riccia fluitans]|uniref:Uncharacterized protein n=1 Tax=Riccia fluitans TaxID=41844 RepID=A0ABD1Z2V5_9MARC